MHIPTREGVVTHSMPGLRQSWGVLCIFRWDTDFSASSNTKHSFLYFLQLLVWLLIQWFKSQSSSSHFPIISCFIHNLSRVEECQENAHSDIMSCYMNHYKMIINGLITWMQDVFVHKIRNHQCYNWWNIHLLRSHRETFCCILSHSTMLAVDLFQGLNS